MAEQMAEQVTAQVTELTQQLPGDGTQSRVAACPLPPGEKQAGDDSLTPTQDLASAQKEDKDTEATGAKHDHLECEFPLAGIVAPKKATELQAASLKERDAKTLDELTNGGETAGNTCEETPGPTAPDIEEDMEPPIAEEDHTSKIQVPESTTKDNQVDGPKPEDTTTEAGHTRTDTTPNVKQPDVKPDSVQSSTSTKGDAESDSSDNMEQADGNEREEQITSVETIGATCQEATEPTLPEDTGMFAGGKRFLIGVAVVAVLAILVQYFCQWKSPPQIDDMQQIDIFLRQLDKVKTQFPNQRSELWSRSRIHLKRHLQTSQPTEPVSLILTAGIKAERTLRCLARGLASAFSSALNASVLHIDGARTASQDSDKVKLDIDRLLQGAFEGDKPVAVIHRFEELPPGSTLIFYRYCDHENAAFKKTFLIFTVLLGDEAIPGQIRLSDVEEMVDDHLQKKFLSHAHPVSFDRMDLNKYGGLWSRISHLILPVASEERAERDGCEDT